MHPLIFVKSVFSESDGTGSWGRIGSFAALLAVIGWVTHIVIYTHTIPDLTGSTAFVGTPYLINKGHNAVTNIMGKGNQ